MYVLSSDHGNISYWTASRPLRSPFGKDSPPNGLPGEVWQTSPAQEASPAPRWPKTLNVVIFVQFSQKTKETKGGPQKVVIFLQFSKKTKKTKILGEMGA